MKRFYDLVFNGLKLALSCIFLLAAIAKIRDSEAFLLSMQSSKVIPIPLAPLLLHLVPAIELYLSLGLLIGSNFVTLLRGMTILTGLFVIYNIFAEWAAGETPRPPCGCFGMDVEAGFLSSPTCSFGKRA